MSETIRERAKRYLLGNYTLLEKYNIDFDLNSIIEKFSGRALTKEIETELTYEITRELEILKSQHQIVDFLVVNDNSIYSATHRININIKATPIAETVQINVTMV